MTPSGTPSAIVRPEQVEDVSQALPELATPFAVVGQVAERTGVRVLRDGEAVHYTEIHCEEDELARVRALCPRDGQS
jgi:nitrogen regulatory protein PII